MTGCSVRHNRPGWRALLLLLICVCAAPAAGPFFFVQISDPQFGMYSGGGEFAQESANLEFAVAAINRLKPAFVVATGDLVNKPGDAALIAEYKRIAGKLAAGIRLYNVPGNHDVGNQPTPQSLAAWRDNFGPDFYTFRTGQAAFFVLDSGLLAAPEKVPEEAARQQRWLAAELERARRDGMRHLVVFQHHPYFVGDAAEKDQYFNVPLTIRRKCLDMLAAAGITHVFAGHLHRNAAGRDGNLEMVTTGPVGKPLGAEARSGFRVVIVTDSGISHRFYDFGNLPERIDPEQ